MLLEKINLPIDLKHLNSDQLSDLCKELSSFYINSIAKIGGHLGGSLGVIELTVALHYVFNMPKDKLIWDVGHQSHIHKIITGRRDKITTLKQESGLSGFTKRTESVYDPFGAGHSSTSISAALGMEIGRILQNKNNYTIAVIGDGAMSAGMAFEALNNAGSLKNRLIVILNDNQMSISPSVGALSNHLSKISLPTTQQKVKDLIKSSIENIPLKIFFKKALKTLENSLKNVASSNNIFENLGFDYLGPIDGHNIEDMVNIFEAIKSDSAIDKPVLIHVLTKKGNGFYSSNGCEEEHFHAVNKFCPETGLQEKPKLKAPTYTQVFANSLIREAEKDDKIVAITAAMASGTGLNSFQKKFPSRFFDVGIAEQHAVTFAAGLACENMSPFVAIYSTFLQRAYDQVIHDVAIQKLPVRFAIDRAGLVGEDGSTHAGTFDLAFLSVLPNFVVMAPSDEDELSKMVATAAAYDDGPISFRYPRGESTGAIITAEKTLNIGHGRIVREGSDVAILSLGTRLQEAIKAAEILESQYNVSATVADARFAKPIDTKLIKQLLRNHRMLITVEEGSIGGFATQVNNFILQNNLNSKNSVIKNLFLPDIFLDHAPVHSLYERANINANGIVSAVTEVFGVSNVTAFTKKIIC